MAYIITITSIRGMVDNAGNDEHTIFDMLEEITQNTEDIVIGRVRAYPDAHSKNTC